MGPDITNSIADALLAGLSEFVAGKMGLYFTKERLHDLERGLGSAAKEFGFESKETCARWLMSSPLTREQVEILAGHLTVGETYFFRDKKSFETLEWEVLTRLIDSRRGSGRYLRIWSAGCATGEEPYSIAILLGKMIPDPENWNIFLLATDINPRFLGKAAKGVYSEWSFRDTPSWVRERYFRKTKGSRFDILRHIKEMVTFEYHNLAEDAYPSLVSNTNAMDVILCRNVLMYFSPGMQRKVIQNLYRCLVDSGWLIVSPSEISGSLFPEFAAVNFPGATFFRKEMKNCPARETLVPVEDQFRAAFDARVEPPEYAGALQPEIDFSGKAQEVTAETGEKREVELLTDRYEEALVFYERGCYDEAAAKIELLLSENQSDSKSMALLAMTYANQGRLSGALEWSEKAVSLDKTNPDRHYLLATILQEQGKIGEAVTSLKRSLYLDQDFALAHFVLGNLMRRQGRGKEADKCFKNALSLLNRRGREEILAASEGLTAGRLIEIINSTSGRSNEYE